MDLARESLRRIYAAQPRFNAFITITEELALSQARLADDELARGVDRGPLHGIPYALKDCFTTKGIRTTCGSKIFADYVPDYDSFVCKKLTEAGAVLMGKTGLHELAYGITSDNPHFGTIRNPRQPAHSPGGSSGGSGAAVTADLVFFAMGTDTGGSIRIPAAWCGCTGFKPTFDRIDTAGLMHLGISQDHAGPLTRTPEDARLVMGAFMDMGFEEEAPARIGIPTNFFTEGLSPVVAASFEEAIRRTGEAGFQVVPVSVPDPAAINTASRTILLKEAAELFAPYLDRRGDFGADVLALLDQGVLVSEPAFTEARRLQGVYKTAWDEVWQECDFVFTPTVSIEAPVIGQKNSGSEDVRVLATRFVRPFDFLGLPACSIPSPSAQLPVGLQIVGGRCKDSAVLGIAERVYRLYEE